LAPGGASGRALGRLVLSLAVCHCGEGVERLA